MNIYPEIKMTCPCCQCVEQPAPPAQFDYIYNPDGTCAGRYDCGKPGVVLAFDDFSPESATWFCEECWDDFNIVPFLIIVEDKRPKIESPGEA